MKSQETIEACIRGLDEMTEKLQSAPNFDPFELIVLQVQRMTLEWVLEEWPEEEVIGLFKPSTTIH